jgi:RNA polymerase sigma-70 factor (ECF subfamily)
METEAELIYKILCGDESAFIELYNKYSKMLIGFIYRHTNDINETSDILQETFVRLLENIKEYNPKGSFKSYIFTIALNITRDRKRKESFEKKMMPKIYEETISTKDENEDKLK